MSTEPGRVRKRFYAEAAAAFSDDGWTVRLDGRPIRTPSANPFIAPRPVAEAAAAEWAAQVEVIDPRALPITRAVNTAIDRIAPQREAVVDEISGYGGTDLVCYRAEGPEGLIAAQAQVWDPLLEWAAESLGARLICVQGVMHAAQPPQALAALRAAVARRSVIGLAALHELTTISGSLLLALGVDHTHLDPEAAWTASRIDEEWQIAQWGSDAEAEAVAERRRGDFLAAARLAALLREIGD
ncbi:MAG: ATPase [Rhodobacteraceae bacterium]|nr:ATPase [Paracoccaceae bacterium]